MRTLQMFKVRTGPKPEKRFVFVNLCSEPWAGFAMKRSWDSGPHPVVPVPVWGGAPDAGQRHAAARAALLPGPVQRPQRGGGRPRRRATAGGVGGDEAGLPQELPGVLAHHVQAGGLYRVRWPPLPQVLAG